MRCRYLVPGFLILFIALATPGRAAAGLLGTEITLGVSNPSGFVFGPATTTVGPGIEFSEGTPSSGATVDVTDTTLTISFFLHPWNTDPLTFAFHSDVPGAFIHANLASNSFPAASFSASSTDLVFSCCTGLPPVLDVTNFEATFTGLGTSIPEPAGSVLLGVGCVCILLQRKWRRDRGTI